MRSPPLRHSSRPTHKILQVPKAPEFSVHVVGFKGLLRFILQKVYHIDNVLTPVSKSGQNSSPLTTFEEYGQSLDVRVGMSKFMHKIYLEL